MPAPAAGPVDLAAQRASQAQSQLSPPLLPAAQAAAQTSQHRFGGPLTGLIFTEPHQPAEVAHLAIASVAAN